jgi:hypothetical protein
MSNITLYTTDENTPSGIREASFQEVLDTAGRLLAQQRRAARPRPSESYLRKNALNDQPATLSLYPSVGVDAGGTVVLAIVGARL